MHGAPSVSYPVGRCRWAAGLAVAAWLLGAAALAAWGWQSAVAAGALAAAGALLAACGVVAALAWWRSPQGALRWTGTEWTFDGLPAGSPEVALDLQGLLLLRLPGAGRPRWLWLESGRAADWDAVRRAVYSRADTPVTVASP
jgi:toxin CptA